MVDGWVEAAAVDVVGGSFASRTGVAVDVGVGQGVGVKVEVGTVVGVKVTVRDPAVVVSNGLGLASKITALIDVITSKKMNAFIKTGKFLLFLLTLFNSS